MGWFDSDYYKKPVDGGATQADLDRLSQTEEEKAERLRQEAYEMEYGAAARADARSARQTIGGSLSGANTFHPSVSATSTDMLPGEDISEAMRREEREIQNEWLDRAGLTGGLRDRVQSAMDEKDQNGQGAFVKWVCPGEE